MDKKFLFTSESVTEGHPDKIADQISDSILDAILEKDPCGRVACETIVTTGQVHVFGEVTTTANVNYTDIISKKVNDIGYTNPTYGFDGKHCGILLSIGEQSPDIALGVDKSLESKNGETKNYDIGAGDQGMMFGYATNETEPYIKGIYMPLPIALAHKLAYRLSFARKNNEITYLRPDGKTQVTVEYENGKPLRVHTIVISTQHNPDISQKQIEEDMIERIIKKVIPPTLLDEQTRYLINPTGRFVIGGPQGDAGLTGRKIIVDTYGGMARHGGGAFSGKDPTKVDRSAAYAARYVAKNIVASGIADRCEIQLSYAIGVAKPVSILVDTFGTGCISDTEIEELITKHFELRPAGIIDMLSLRNPIYKQTAVYGHFGRQEADFPWERIDKAEILRKDAGIQ